MDITKNCQTVICDQKIQTWIVYSSNFYPHNSFNFIRYSDRLSVLLIVDGESSGLTAELTRATPVKVGNIWIE